MRNERVVTANSGGTGKPRVSSSLSRALALTSSSRASPSTTPPPRGKPTMRAVDSWDHRLVVSPFPLDQVVGYATPVLSSASPMTVSSSGAQSPSPVHARRSLSPYGFVPILNDEREGPASRSGGGTTTPVLQYEYVKGTAASPSIQSTMTAETTDMTLDSRVNSPATFYSVGMPPLYQRPAVLPQDRDSPRPKTPTGGKRSPFPKLVNSGGIGGGAGDDDSVRRCRIKTEMCMHYANGNPCPFGANCTYAHGEEELQMTKLIDLHNAGLIDMETYRIKPCFTWVMTGSCPFGKRCTSIHDPRVGGLHPSWLPHTETQGNSITTDINVEALHQKRNHAILYDNPFGEHYSLHKDGFSDIYKLICNMDYSKNGWIGTRRQAMVHPIVSLQIALLLRGDADWQYKYRPQHIIYDELCMVLQKRAFRVTASMEVVEMSINAYNPRLPNHILVREIAFGPDSDPTVRGVALWFNIAEDDVTLCTPQQAKRFRWKRSIKKEPEALSKPSVFDSLEHFAMIRPHDQDAFGLATDVLEHRLRVCIAERVNNMRERYETLQNLEITKRQLQHRFDRLRRHWFRWAWPIAAGRETVDRKTPAPPVDGQYEPTEVKTNDENDSVLGSAVLRIWSSFIEAGLEGSEAEIQNGYLTRKSDPGQGNFIKRLKVFENLAQGMPMDKDRSLQHILQHTVSNTKTDRPHSRQQERCWKSLLLKPTQTHEGNEWDIVREHFSNSRSKRVLSIIQQN